VEHAQRFEKWRQSIASPFSPIANETSPKQTDQHPATQQIGVEEEQSIDVEEAASSELIVPISDEPKDTRTAKIYSGPIVRYVLPPFPLVRAMASLDAPTTASSA
jgi:hypothetical protein